MLDNPEFTRAAGFGNNGYGRRLEWADEGEKLSLRKRSYVPPFGALMIYHFSEFVTVLQRGIFVGRGLGIRESGEIDEETIAHSGGDLDKTQEKTGFAQSVLPSISFVWHQQRSGSLLEDSAELRGIWIRTLNMCGGVGACLNSLQLSATWSRVVCLLWNELQSRRAQRKHHFCCPTCRLPRT